MYLMLQISTNIGYLCNSCYDMCFSHNMFKVKVYMYHRVRHINCVFWQNFYSVTLSLPIYRISEILRKFLNIYMLATDCKLFCYVTVCIIYVEAQTGKSLKNSCHFIFTIILQDVWVQWLLSLAYYKFSL